MGAASCHRHHLRGCSTPRARSHLKTCCSIKRSRRAEYVRSAASPSPEGVHTRTNGNVRRCYCNVYVPTGNAVRELSLMSAREVKSGTRRQRRPAATIGFKSRWGSWLRLVNSSEECLTGSAERSCPGVGERHDARPPSRAGARPSTLDHGRLNDAPRRIEAPSRRTCIAKAAREGSVPKVTP
jgi:hypothetical protein